MSTTRAERTKRSDATTQPAASAKEFFSTRPEPAIQWFVESAPAGITMLRGARLRIGRGDDCHVRLESNSVSRRHAELYRQGPIYALRDLQSTNGTSVNGTRVDHAAIAAGDVVRVGDCVGVVFEVDPAAATSAFGELAPGLWGGARLSSALSHAQAAAPTDVPIVIVGETGVGKERIARALHLWSGRLGRFNAVNCSTIPSPLAESELFGHVRGAFTGAERARAGHFQAAHGGTLFLDEIADLSLDVQAKLLRVVEEGELVQLGGTATTPVDVRIVVAAHERLEVLVEQKRFRADLYARLAGFVVDVPPLRERRQEIPAFFGYLLAKHSAGEVPQVAATLLEWLCLRPWPGNVRELELMVRKLLALRGTEPELGLALAQEIADSPLKAGSASTPPSVQKFRDRRASDLHRLKLALEASGGNLTAAAGAVGISRRRAYRLLEPTKSEAAPTASGTIADDLGSSDH